MLDEGAKSELWGEYQGRAPFGGSSVGERERDHDDIEGVIGHGRPPRRAPRPIQSGCRQPHGRMLYRWAAPCTTTILFSISNAMLSPACKSSFSRTASGMVAWYLRVNR